MCARMTANPHDRVGREVIRHRRLILSLARLHAAIGHGQANQQSSQARPSCKLRRATGNERTHIFCLFAQTLKHLKHSLPSLDLKADPQRVNRYEAAFSLFVAAGCDSGLCRANPALNIPVNGPAEQLQVDLRTTQHAARCCPVDALSFNPPTAKINHSKKGSLRARTQTCSNRTAGYLPLLAVTPSTHQHIRNHSIFCGGTNGFLPRFGGRRAFSCDPSSAISRFISRFNGPTTSSAPIALWRIFVPASKRVSCIHTHRRRRDCHCIGEEGTTLPTAQADISAMLGVL